MVKWQDKQSYMEAECPSNYQFDETLVFLKRSNQEMHRVEGRIVYKALKVDGSAILFSVTEENDKLYIHVLKGKADSLTKESITVYVTKWFDLERDVAPFYQLAQQDPYLSKLVQQYSGLRIVGIPDLFEAFVWAIAGQQINLTFAYTLKRRFVEQFGEKLDWEGEAYWLFPEPEDLADCTIEMLRVLQFSSRKAEYILGIAEKMRDGSLQQALRENSYQELKKELLSIRGIGAWTADYVLMKCFRMQNAFPIADAGIHQALKQQLGRKPTLEEIAKLARNWAGWEAYATIYLWRSLNE
ncbi:DNA-3-methyladenine glycosylase family protein [Oceanobacillus manasiensis]|uniref:DNA-3-methyladenine glycosylase family protein n=1 Tax=Oceanobacillus manasiensis TaxID=586413 RepID=UPI0005AA371E|nr:DNA-3-methyladenine glycosylase [Oceanobacillus manasiensis]